MRELSLVAASGGHSSSRCAGLSLPRPLLLRSTGSRRTGSVIVAHGPRCSAACGIFPDQGSNPCPLHWQADSQPLCHQGSPRTWNFCHVNFTRQQTAPLSAICIENRLAAWVKCRRFSTLDDIGTCTWGVCTACSTAFHILRLHIS